MWFYPNNRIYLTLTKSCPKNGEYHKIPLLKLQIKHRSEMNPVPAVAD